MKLITILSNYLNVFAVILSSGDILVFLTGQDEIESLAKLITDCARHCGSGQLALLVLKQLLLCKNKNLIYLRCLPYLSTEQ